MQKILIIILISVSFVACKKGEDDPIISLRTRDARIIGIWELKKMSVSVGTASAIYSFDGTTLTISKSGSVVSTSKYNSEIIFRKKGRFDSKYSITTLTYNSAPVQNAIQSTQNFIGDWSWADTDKKKSSLTINNSIYSSFYLLNNNYTETHNVMKVLRLTNKELVLESNSSYPSTSISNGSTTLKESYTYEKKK